jgi:SAM-dependent methyltransferase
MQRIRLHAALLIALLAFVATALPDSAHAQAAKEYTPQVGQEGKDVIWVPTPLSLVERMLDMAKLTPKDIHYDLGSGDGRTVIAAAKRGAQSYGVEYNPDMVALSERNAAKEGVAGKAKFIHGDIFQTDFSQATVLTLYLLPSLNVKLRPTILKMKPGTRVVSHAFTMDDWQADQTASVEGRTAYLWIVPARVEGTWKWNVSGSGPRAYELMLRQQYQQVEGVVRLDDKLGQLRDVKLDGDRIAFSVIEQTGGTNPIRRDFTGRVNGDTIEGSVKYPGGEAKWTATHAK